MACERCTRLGRECVFSNTSQFNRPKQDSKDRIDRLQEQVDDLAAQLAQKDSESAHNPLNPEIVSGSQASDTLPEISLPAPEPCSYLFTRGAITVAEAGRLVEKFRTCKMPQFPFVIIPPKMSVPTLCEQYPFLLLTVMTCCLEDNLQLQGELASEVKKVISTRVILNNERSMDLLLGLLVHIAWYHYHWQTMHTQMYMLLQMTIMIVVDLDLDKDENFGLYSRTQRPGKTSAETHYRSPAGKRALLACFYLCSVSSLFRKQLFMRHTKWIDQCCNILLETPEYPTDTLLKTYIDIQLLSRKSEETLNLDDHDWAHRATDPNMNVVLELLQEQGTQIRASVPQAELQDHWTLSLDLQAIPTYILGHEMRHRNSISGSSDTGQLCFLLRSTYSSVSSLLELPLDTMVHLPLSSHTTLWYCLLILSKLTLLSSTDVWDEKAGFKKEDVYQLGLDVMTKFRALSIGDDVWANSGRVVGSMLSWFEKHRMSSLQLSDTGPHRGIARSSHESSHGVRTSDYSYATNTSEPAWCYGQPAALQDGTNINPISFFKPLSLQDNQAAYIEDSLTQGVWSDTIWEKMLEDFIVTPTALATFGSPSLRPLV